MKSDKSSTLTDREIQRVVKGLMDWRRATGLLAVVSISVLIAACDGSGSGSAPGDNPTPPVNQPDPTTPPQNMPRLGKVIISEAAASNAVFLDEDGDDSDWFELYNSADTAQNLGGWTLTDDEEKPAQWTLPEVILQPGEMLMIWASDKDRDGAQLHTNFKLSTDGELLQLYDADGSLVSSLLVAGAPAGVTVGLDAAGDVVFFDSPTPGAINSTISFAGVVSGTVNFSSDGGANAPASVSLSGASAREVIRYTLDATIPTAQSPVFSEPLGIDQATVVRARLFRDGYIPSATASRTYLPDAQHDLPIVSLITEPANFFDEDTGIYVYGNSYEEGLPYRGANFWEEWERDVHFSFYEPDGKLGTEFNAGVQIFGGWSRTFDQRSLAVYARGKYGTREIEYPLFPDLPYDEFQSLVLRNSGNDWMHTMIRDAVLTSLMEGSGLDYQAYRPTVTYLNGEYWGIYNLREKANEHMLASKHDLDADDINLLENDSEIMEGDNKEYLQLIDFVTDNNLAVPANYAQVAEQMDIANFIMYQAAQIYFNNTDWPFNNIKYWNSPETKWRWILYGAEFSFGLYDEDSYGENALARATAGEGEGGQPWSTLLLRSLLENPGFSAAFVNTFADLLNSRFKPAHVVERIDQYAGVIATETPAHWDRWGGFTEEPPVWEERLQVMRSFAEQRPAFVWEHIMSHFGLVAPRSVTIRIPDTTQGRVQVNSLSIEQSEWTGEYFPGIPITVTATAAEGYRFSHWSGDSDAGTVSITVDPATVADLQPEFLAIDMGQ